MNIKPVPFVRNREVRRCLRMAFVRSVLTKKDLNTKGKELSGMNKLNSQKIIQLIEQLEEYRREAHKRIDENPFIRKKVSWLDRLYGVHMSQADLMKGKIDIMFDENTAIIIYNSSLYDKLSLSKTKHSPLSKSKGVKREKKKGAKMDTEKKKGGLWEK